MGEDQNLSTEETKVEGEITEAEKITEQPKEEDKPVTTEVDEPPTRDEKELARLHYEKRQAAKVKKEVETVENEEILPEDKDLISKVVEEKYGSAINDLISHQQEVKNEKEIQDYIAQNPHAKEFEAQARAWMKHESRRSLPVSSVFNEIIGANYAKILQQGKEMATEANAQANLTKPIGNAMKPIKKDPKDMTSEEIRQERQRILSGQ